MNSLTPIQVAATREGGAVRRCHAVPHNSMYNVAQHSFGAVSLLLLLNPAPSLALIKAVQWHDVGERWLGDVPSPGKGLDLHLSSHYERVEASLLMKLGLAQNLDPAERDWLKSVDVLELWLWCREEEALGNRNVSRMRVACEATLEDLGDHRRMPAEVRDYYEQEREQPQTRLSDFFHEVEDMIG